MPKINRNNPVINTGVIIRGYLLSWFSKENNKMPQNIKEVPVTRLKLMKTFAVSGESETKLS